MVINFTISHSSGAKMIWNLIFTSTCLSSYLTSKMICSIARIPSFTFIMIKVKTKENPEKISFADILFPSPARTWSNVSSTYSIFNQSKCRVSELHSAHCDIVSWWQNIIFVWKKKLFNFSHFQSRLLILIAIFAAFT